MLRSVCLYARVYSRGKAWIGPHFLFLEGSSLENAKPFAIRFFLYSPFSAHDTMCLIWTRLKMLQGIVRILKSVSHWFQINIYKHRWSMRWTGLVSCLRPHTSTTLCNSSVCVSMLCFETVLACVTALLTNCGPFNRRSRTCLGAIWEPCCKWLQG